MSVGVNLAVAEAAGRGVLTAASWMANGSAAQEAAAMGRRFSQLDVGIHLVLTCGRPVTGPDRVPSLVSQQGTFWNLGAFCRRLATGRIALDEVRREWEAQVEQGHRLGLQFRHLDGHHHVQLHPRLAPIAAGIAGAHGMTARCRAPQWPDGGGMRTLVAQVTLGPWARRSRRCWKQFAGADCVWSLTAGDALGDAGILLEWTRHVRGRWTEWVLHPAAVDDIPPETDCYSAGRLGEYRALLHPDLPQALAAIAAVETRAQSLRLVPLE